MERYTEIQLANDIITKLSTTTNTYEVDFDNCDITVTHTDENGFKYVLSVFFDEFIPNRLRLVEIDDIDEEFIALLKRFGLKFNWLHVLEGEDVIFDEWRFRGLDDISFDFIFNWLEEVAKKNIEEQIRLEEEEENELKNLAKKFGILPKSS